MEDNSVEQQRGFLLNSILKVFQFLADWNQKHH